MPFFETKKIIYQGVHFWDIFSAYYSFFIFLRILSKGASDPLF